MKRHVRLLTVALGLAFVPYLPAQEPARDIARTEEHGGEPGIGWTIANFALLVIFLGYIIRKNAGKFFEARTQQIQGSLAEAAKSKREADQRVADMERRLASLAGEIEDMRANMRKEMAAESERIQRETERHVSRLQQDAEQEIENMIKAARRELKMYAADLAVHLAEQQLKGRITRDVENNLVSSFVADLRERTGGNTHN